MVIKDPSTGQGAVVSIDGGLKTFATISEIEHYESHQRGNVFFVTHTVAAPSSGENTVFFFKSTDTNDDYSMLISKIAVSCESNAQWSIYTGTDRTSGGGSLTPINSNTGSANSPSVLIYGSNEGDFIIETGQKYRLCRFLTTAWNSMNIESRDAHLVSYNKTFGILCKTTIGANLYITVMFTRHIKEK